MVKIAWDLELAEFINVLLVDLKFEPQFRQLIIYSAECTVS